MAFYYILLGHLVGDFVLQTNKIAANKPFYRRWSIIHAVVVTLCMLIFALPFGFTTIALVLISGILHFYIDKSKTIFSDRFKLPDLVVFLADQALHVLLAAAASAFASGSPEGWFVFVDPVNVGILIVVLLVCFFAAIFNQYIILGLFKQADRPFFKRGEKTAGIVSRLLLLAGLYFGFRISPFFFLLIPAAPACLYFYGYFFGSGPDSRKELFFKTLLDLAFSAGGAAILLCSVPL